LVGHGRVDIVDFVHIDCVAKILLDSSDIGLGIVAVESEESLEDIRTSRKTSKCVREVGLILALDTLEFIGDVFVPLAILHQIGRGQMGSGNAEIFGLKIFP